MKISVQNNLQLNKLTKPPPKTGSVCGLEKPILRNPSIVMTLNKLGSALFRNLSVFVGASHSHEAQKPQTINLNDIN